MVMPFNEEELIKCDFKINLDFSNENNQFFLKNIIDIISDNGLKTKLLEELDNIQDTQKFVQLSSTLNIFITEKCLEFINESNKKQTTDVNLDNTLLLLILSRKINLLMVKSQTSLNTNDDINNNDIFHKIHFDLSTQKRFELLMDQLAFNINEKNKALKDRKSALDVISNLKNAANNESYDSLCARCQNSVVNDTYRSIENIKLNNDNFQMKSNKIENYNLSQIRSTFQRIDYMNNTSENITDTVSSINNISSSASSSSLNKQDGDGDDQLSRPPSPIEKYLRVVKNISQTRILVDVTRYILFFNPKPYHKYEIKITLVKQSNIILLVKRYSQLKQMHDDLTIKYHEIGSLVFPPKRLIMNLDESFVYHRLIKLKAYLISLFRVLQNIFTSPIGPLTNEIDEQCISKIHPIFTVD